MVETTGEGELTFAPDWAYLRIGVQSNDSSASGASAGNADKLASVLGALGEQDLGSDMVETVGFGVNPHYDYSAGGRLVDYRARVDLKVRVVDLGTLGALIDAVLLAGATDIPKIQYQVADEEAKQREALALAFAQARSKAEALAEAAGKALGDLSVITTEGTYSTMFDVEAITVAGYASLAGGAQITPSNVSIRAWVKTRWQLVSAR